MYSPRIIQKNVEKVESRTNTKLVRYPYAKVEEWQQRLGPAPRTLSKDETAFVVNEQLMCSLDFTYWAERYHTIDIDGVLGGGIGKMRIGPSQDLLLKIIAKAEEEEKDKVERGETADGIMIADHKARQVWHTALCRALTVHRAMQVPNSRCVAGSVDDEKIQELYERDLKSYENLPWYLKPGIKFNEKNEHMAWTTGSKVTYMISSKKSSFGQGVQNDVGHMTELSEFENPWKLEIDLFPTFPQSPNTLVVLESRANGRTGWWREFTESVRKQRKPRWRYCFIPWYAEPRKYRRTHPVGWEPDEVAILHAKKVYETSPEFVGKAVFLSKEQLYWWWTTREEYREAGTLNFFLTNYCATPEESFQHSGESAFDSELLDDLRLRSLRGRPYEFSVDREDGQTIWMPGCGGLKPMEAEELDNDARGIVWMYEPPDNKAKYFLGCDPTKGIVGWSREFRRDADQGTDNGVIQVLKVGGEAKQDVQVAEYAAPIDPEDLADVVYLLGKLYGGSNDDGEAMVNVEVWPGPGEPTQRKLITKYGYANVYMPIKYSNTIIPERGHNVAGWISNERSRRELWRRGMKHIALKRVRLFSPDLIEEMADCQADDWRYTETARAKYGKHDDRVVTLFLAIYAAHDWGDEIETVKPQENEKPKNWQAMAMTSE